MQKVIRVDFSLLMKPLHSFNSTICQLCSELDSFRFFELSVLIPHYRFSCCMCDNTHYQLHRPHHGLHAKHRSLKLLCGQLLGKFDYINDAIERCFTPVTR